jgi:hypothetical protein
MPELKVRSISGTATPVFATDLKPAALDNALGTTAHREAWLESNVSGRAAQTAYTAAATAWVRENPETNYADRVAWIHARDVSCRDLEAAISASERTAKALLIAYDAAQRSGFASARGSFAEAWLSADAAAIKALGVLDAALTTRESLTRFVCVPERSAEVGRGHWLHSSNLDNGRKNATAKIQRDEMALIVMTAPRLLVAAKAAK